MRALCLAAKHFWSKWGFCQLIGCQCKRPRRWSALGKWSRISGNLRIRRLLPMRTHRHQPVRCLCRRRTSNWRTHAGHWRCDWRRSLHDMARNMFEHHRPGILEWIECLDRMNSYANKMAGSAGHHRRQRSHYASNEWKWMRRIANTRSLPLQYSKRRFSWERNARMWILTDFK